MKKEFSKGKEKYKGKRFDKSKVLIDLSFDGCNAQ